MSVLVLPLAAGVVAYVVLGWLQTNRRAKLGLTNAAVVAADNSEIGSPTLRSDRLGLVGRPDHLVRIDGTIIPVGAEATRTTRARLARHAARGSVPARHRGVRRTAAVRPVGPGEWGSAAGAIHASPRETRAGNDGPHASCARSRHAARPALDGIAMPCMRFFRDLLGIVRVRWRPKLVSPLTPTRAGLGSGRDITECPAK